MKKKFLAFSLTALLTFGLVGCGTPNSSSTIDDTSSSSKTTSAIDPNDTGKFEYLKEDTSSLPEAKVTEIRVHYNRNDYMSSLANYDKWTLWLWDATNNFGGVRLPFTYADDYGVWMKFNISDITDGKESKSIGFIVSTATWAKDVEDDRFIEVQESAPGGIQHVYLRSGKQNIYESAYAAFQTSLTTVRFLSFKTVRVSFDPADDFKIVNSSITVLKNGEKFTDFEVTESTKTYCVLTFKNELKLSDSIVIEYTFDDGRKNSSDMVITNYFDEEEFANNFNYTGDDLGVTFDDESNVKETRFKLWAPTCRKVQLTVKEKGDSIDNILDHVDLTLGEKGVWSYKYQGDLSNKYYFYTVTNSKGTNDVVDPYAKSASTNGKIGMITNFTKINKEIDGWDKDERPNFGENGTDASIYEVHVRDMTINDNANVKVGKGKFLGLAQTGTYYENVEDKVSTGLDHMKELGVTHVQLQPSYDFSSVDESKENNSMSATNYNWGYDPLNYNVLEGSYSTDPSDGTVRIKEFKEMVMAMHNAGLNINMDVVYNHTSSLNNSNFELIVPYYYHRFTNTGKAYNGSGCGNEMATDRFMVNKFVRESCKMYIDEYHLSGFRFDLMGLMDNQTMIDIYKDCSAIYDKIMVYGEPWTGGSSKLISGNNASYLRTQQTVQTSLAQPYFVGDKVYVGAFADGFRNGVKGGQSDSNASAGFVQGLKDNVSALTPAVTGRFAAGYNVEPEQVLNYVSCHDNFTLYDHLITTVNSSKNLYVNGNESTPRVFNDVYTQAEMLVFTMQGVPFIQEGEDFMRSKSYVEDGKTKYNGNSYNAGDFINNMNYELKIENKDVEAKIKEIIKYRKDTPALTLSSRDLISNSVKEINADASKGNLSYKISYEGKELYIIHSLDGGEFELNGYSNLELANNGENVTIANDKVTLKANTSVVLSK